MKSILGAFLLCFFSTMGFAHSNSLGLENFVTSNEKFVAWVTSKAPIKELEVLNAFELGNGNRVYVFKSSALSTLKAQLQKETQEASASLKEFSVEPGEILAFVETNQQIKGHQIIGGQGRIRGLFKLQPETFAELVKDPMNMIHAVNLQEGLGQNAPISENLSLQNLKLRKYLSSNFLKNKEKLNQQLRTSPVSTERLMKNLSILAGEAGFVDDRDPKQKKTIAQRGSDEGRDLTRQFLVQEFTSLGLEAKTWCYTSGFRKGCNVVATLRKNLRNNFQSAKETESADDSKTLVISSHLDSVQNAGADDNGSGTAALLELAKLLKNEKLSINVVFMAFDQEELGLVGSAKIAPEVDTEIPGQFLANLNTDMIAYDSDSDGAIHAMDCNRKDSAWLKQAAVNAIASWQIPLSIVDACTNRSDHASFWKQDKAAFLLSENFFGGDSNECYHKKCDKMNLINEAYYGNNVSLLYGMTLLISKGVAEFQGRFSLR